MWRCWKLLHLLFTTELESAHFKQPLFGFITQIHYCSCSHLIVHLQTGEHGVLKAHVHPHHMVHQRVGLVCLQRGGDGETCGRVSVQDVHQFLLLYGPCRWGRRGREKGQEVEISSRPSQSRVCQPVNQLPSLCTINLINRQECTCLGCFMMVLPNQALKLKLIISNRPLFKTTSTLILIRISRQLD